MSLFSHTDYLPLAPARRSFAPPSENKGLSTTIMRLSLGLILAALLLLATLAICAVKLRPGAQVPAMESNGSGHRSCQVLHQYGGTAGGGLKGGGYYGADD